MTGLMLHVDSHPVTREELDSIPCPQETATWCPIPHAEFVDTIVDTVERAGVPVTDVRLGLSDWEDSDDFGRSRHRMFGVIDTGEAFIGGDAKFQIGFRSSTDQRFAATVVWGGSVFVCDNLIIAGEETLRRKHTPEIRRDLAPMLAEKIDRYHFHKDQQDTFFAHLKDSYVSDTVAKATMVDACAAGVLPWSAIPEVEGEWQYPTHDAFAPRSAWSLYNAFTEGRMKRYPTDQAATRVMNLTRTFRSTFTPEFVGM